MKCTLVTIVLLFSALPAHAHGGRLDTYGCHQDKKAGDYHCHKGKFRNQTFKDKWSLPGGPKQIIFTAVVVRVIDGDTLDVDRDGEIIRIRLANINAPELSEPGGHAAKQGLINQVLGKRVTVKVHGKGKYGRTIAEVLSLARSAP